MRRTAPAASGWAKNLGVEKPANRALHEAPENRVMELCDILLRKCKPGVSMSETLSQQLFFFDKGKRERYDMIEGSQQIRFKVERDKTVNFENFFTALRNWFGRGTRENVARDEYKQQAPRIVLAPITRRDARLLFDTLNVVPGRETISLRDMAARMEQYRDGRLKGSKAACDELVERIRRKGRSGRLATCHFDHLGALGGAVMCHNLDGPCPAIVSPGQGEDVQPEEGALGNGLFGYEALERALRIVMHQPPQRDDLRVEGVMPEEEFIAAVQALFERCRQIRAAEQSSGERSPNSVHKISVQDVSKAVEGWPGAAESLAQQQDQRKQPTLSSCDRTCGNQHNLLHHNSGNGVSGDANGLTSGQRGRPDEYAQRHDVLARLHRTLAPSSRHRGGLAVLLGAFGQGGAGDAGGSRAGFITLAEFHGSMCSLLGGCGRGNGQLEGGKASRSQNRRAASMGEFTVEQAKLLFDPVAAWYEDKGLEFSQNGVQRQQLLHVQAFAGWLIEELKAFEERSSSSSTSSSSNIRSRSKGGLSSGSFVNRMPWEVAAGGRDFRGRPPPLNAHDEQEREQAERERRLQALVGRLRRTAKPGAGARGFREELVRAMQVWASVEQMSTQRAVEKLQLKLGDRPPPPSAHPPQSEPRVSFRHFHEALRNHVGLDIGSGENGVRETDARILYDYYCRGSDRNNSKTDHAAAREIFSTVQADCNNSHSRRGRAAEPEPHTKRLAELLARLREMTPIAQSCEDSLTRALGNYDTDADGRLSRGELASAVKGYVQAGQARHRNGAVRRHGRQCAPGVLDAAPARWDGGGTRGAGGAGQQISMREREGSDVGPRNWGQGAGWREGGHGRGRASTATAGDAQLWRVDNFGRVLPGRSCGGGSGGGSSGHGNNDTSDGGPSVYMVASDSWVYSEAAAHGQAAARDRREWGDGFTTADGAMLYEAALVQEQKDEEAEQMRQQERQRGRAGSQMGSEGVGSAISGSGDGSQKDTATGSDRGSNKSGGSGSSGSGNSGGGRGGRKPNFYYDTIGVRESGIFYDQGYALNPRWDGNTHDQHVKNQARKQEEEEEAAGGELSKKGVSLRAVIKLVCPPGTVSEKIAPEDRKLPQAFTV